MGAVVENKRVTELPLNGRNMVNLAVLVPGVQYGNRDRPGRRFDADPYVTGKTYSISANGVRELHQNRQPGRCGREGTSTEHHDFRPLH